MYLCRLEGFGECQRGHDRGEALCHHRFARTGRTDEYDVVAAGACHFKSPLDVLLAFHFQEVVVEYVCGCGKFRACVDDGRFDCRVACQELHDLAERAGAVDVEVVDHSCFRGVGFGQYEAFVAERAREDCHRQGAAYGQQGAVERELAQDHVGACAVGGYLFGCGKDADGYGQVVGGALFLDVRRAEVDDDVAAREVEAALRHCCDDTLVALLDGGVGESHHGELEATRGYCLHVDAYGVDALDGCAVDFYEHITGWGRRVASG